MKNTKFIQSISPGDKSEFSVKIQWLTRILALNLNRIVAC